MDTGNDSPGSCVYHITVQGRLDAGWSEWLGGLDIEIVEQAESDAPLTVLNGPVADQAALRGILERLWDMNLALLAVKRLGAGGQDDGG